MDINNTDLKSIIEELTGQKFNKENKMLSPFSREKTPSFSIYFDSNSNKYKFKDFSTGKNGDALDFLREYKGLGYKEAREYLGFPLEKTEKEKDKDIILNRIDWELGEFRRGQKLLGLFQFTNEKGEVLYYKAKFDIGEGKKQLSYYHLEDGKVINKRGANEVPYNLYNAIEGIGVDKVLIVVEGEKDANMLNSWFKNDTYVATSIKGCKNIDILKEKRMRVYVIGDTGIAGEKYKWEVYNHFRDYVREFKFITLPGLKKLGDNKDVSDWINEGNTKRDLFKAFERSLDIKNKYELQQDRKGIYKTIFKEKSDEIVESKRYIADFKIIEATRIKFVDEEKEGIRLILKSPTGDKIERVGVSTVFDDLRTFKNFLGTIDLSFKGKLDELTDFKAWVNKYFALENEEIYGGIKFIDKDGELFFIENEGSISRNGINTDIKSDKRNNAEVLKNEQITREELQELIKHIFKFAAPEKSISIIGTIINNLAVYQCQELKYKLHHLLIVGESGSGKSTILENVVAPILNYPKKDIRSIGLISNFAFMKTLSDGNYPTLFDEFKPSMMDRYKIGNISETLRNLYDRSTISKGNKSLKTTDFNLCRPIIIAGEESYPNQEKALIERSCIIYLSRRERTEKHTTAMMWIIENEDILNKFGRSLIDIVLNLSKDDYRRLRCSVNGGMKGLNNRVLNTAVNESCGIRILNLLLEKHNLKQLAGFDEHITTNMKIEVLEGSKDTHSLVEKMLILYNQMIEDGRAYADKVVSARGDGVFIKTSEMINQIHEYVNKVGADLIPLKLNDFRKQAKKAGYLISASSKVIKLDRKTVRFDTYDIVLLRELNIDSIAPPELRELADEEDNVVAFKYN
ncbi:CHC2 zinc finger domain-containing protein [Clostridium sp. DL1XJH146]